MKTNLIIINPLVRCMLANELWALHRARSIWKEAGFKMGSEKDKERLDNLIRGTVTMARGFDVVLWLAGSELNSELIMEAIRKVYYINYGLPKPELPPHPTADLVKENARKRAKKWLERLDRKRSKK